jgi:hypothetical protein
MDSYKKDDSAREGRNVHVYDLLEFCPRRHAISLIKRISPRLNKKAPVSLKVTRDIGKSFQKIIVKRFFESGKLVGTWECKFCNKKYFGFYNRTCPFCKQKGLLRYIDTKLKLTCYGIPVVGHVDIMLMRNDRIFLVEIKSIRPEDFVSLSEPSRDNRNQLLLYLWLLSKGATIDIPKSRSVTKFKIDKDSGTILYMCKTHKNMPFKPFDVFLSDGSEFLESIDSKLNELKIFSTVGVLPRQICNSKHAYMARECHVVGECFGEVH